MAGNNIITIDNTRFIYETNFGGNPEGDRFGDRRRKCNIVIPDEEQAKDLMKAGFRVRSTKPKQDDDPTTFVPEYFVMAILKYRDKSDNKVKYPPKVYLVVDDDDPVLMDEDTVGELDKIRVKNVNVVLNPYQYGNSPEEQNLYIRTMYVEQDIDDDPYAAYYRNRNK